jgi:hypothetical protein
MSLEIVRQVSRENPDLLPTNLGRTCYRHTLLLVEKLCANGHDAALMCKSPGEGQYTPDGFQPRTVIGLDGKPYPCSGVSHDAIWCDGKQFDTIGSANEHDRPIYRRQGDPNWSFNPADGPQITASPTWDEIPRVHWRNNNPPLNDGAPPTPGPQPPTPGSGSLPGREEMMNAGQWLHRYYKSPEGLQRPDGLWKPAIPTSVAQPDWEGIGAWLFDVYLRARIAGKNATEATAVVIAEIRKTDEWKQKHPGETT